MEFGITFVIIAFIMFFIVECALYYQAYYSTQTFNDEISSNIVLYDVENICENADDEILNMLNLKAQKYFEPNINLLYAEKSAEDMIVQSESEYFGEKIVNIKISCNDSSSISSVKTNYLFRGPFLFRMGQTLKSTSGAQSPKF